MQSLIQSIKDSKLTPNQLYLLWCLQYEEIPLNINVHTEVRALKNSTHLDAKGKITPLGLEAVSSLPKPSSKAVKTIVLLDDMIEKYRSETLEQYIGNDAIKARIADCIVSNDIPHFIFNNNLHLCNNC